MKALSPSIHLLILTKMKKSSLKFVLTLCAMFAVGSVALQDSWGSKPVPKNAAGISGLWAQTTPPVSPIKRPWEKQTVSLSYQVLLEEVKI